MRDLVKERIAHFRFAVEQRERLGKRDEPSARPATPEPPTCMIKLKPPPHQPMPLQERPRQALCIHRLHRDKSFD
jgi:hypothetical protein